MPLLVHELADLHLFLELVLKTEATYKNPKNLSSHLSINNIIKNYAFISQLMASI